MSFIRHESVTPVPAIAQLVGCFVAVRCPTCRRGAVCYCSCTTLCDGLNRSTHRVRSEEAVMIKEPTDIGVAAPSPPGRRRRAVLASASVSAFHQSIGDEEQREGTVD